MIKRLLILIFASFLTIASYSQSIPKMKMADVVKTFSNGSDTVYVVNFWATFCKPCVGEIPSFIDVVKKYRGQKVKLLLVSLDLPDYYPKKIADFVKKNHFNTNIAWLNETNADIFCPMIDKKWSGAIPATIVVNGKTGYKKFFEDEMTAEQFEKELRGAMGLADKVTISPSFKIPMNKFTSAEYYNKYAEVPSDIVIFKSKDSSVFSVIEGKVNSIVHIDDTEVAIIRDRDGKFYSYANLGKLLIKKGDVIKKDQLIAFAMPDDDEDDYTLWFIFSTSIKNVYLTKENFFARSDTRKRDHSIDSIKEPQ